MTLSDPKQTSQTITEEIGLSGNKEKFVVVKWEQWMEGEPGIMRRQAEVGAETVNQHNNADSATALWETQVDDVYKASQVGMVTKPSEKLLTIGEIKKAADEMKQHKEQRLLDKQGPQGDSDDGSECGYDEDEEEENEGSDSDDGSGSSDDGGGKKRKLVLNKKGKNMNKRALAASYMAKTKATIPTLVKEFLKGDKEISDAFANAQFIIDQFSADAYVHRPPRYVPQRTRFKLGIVHHI